MPSPALLNIQSLATIHKLTTTLSLSHIFFLLASLHRVVFSNPYSIPA